MEIETILLVGIIAFVVLIVVTALTYPSPPKAEVDYNQQLSDEIARAIDAMEQYHNDTQQQLKVYQSSLDLAMTMLQNGTMAKLDGWAVGIKQGLELKCGTNLTKYIRNETLLEQISG